MTERDRHFEGRDLVENTQMSPDAVADNTSLYGGGGRERVVTPPPPSDDDKTSNLILSGSFKDTVLWQFYDREPY